MTSVGVNAYAVELQTWLIHVPTCGIARRVLGPAECCQSVCLSDTWHKLWPTGQVFRDVTSYRVVSVADVSKEYSTFVTSHKTWIMSNTAVISLQRETCRPVAHISIKFGIPKCFGKGKGKVPLWGRSALQPYRLIALWPPKEFLHSSLEALHTKRPQRPQLAKEGTIGGI
jgi:hypothetical protein